MHLVLQINVAGPSFLFTVPGQPSVSSTFEKSLKMRRNDLQSDDRSNTHHGVWRPAGPGPSPDSTSHQLHDLEQTASLCLSFPIRKQASHRLVTMTKRDLEGVALGTLLTA